LLASLGVLYLVIYSLEVVFFSQKQLVSVLEIASNVIWVVFAVDVVIRVIAAESVLEFLKSSWLEVLALIIPFMRSLRVFRVIVALRGLRPFLKTRIETTGTYILLLLPITWFTGAVAVLDAENEGVESSITNLPDALWWSLATITTVGYGEFYPKTLEGKFVAGVLMIMGIALFSAGAGMFASWILGEKKDAD
jgi:voltage-gated potassium channel